eukprot:CAMPEP_0177173100 /NCGR_PEP_ID=MMETSP0367-20130122/11482_1 /TAXON_ID=447022 ORGANISM="Scrippsiella hangoei-like, Strain SHHI-4" /NCGR_SAMPLE_ID=MMETSP0367 /ASSEMBLY_ACC=CAM_ASM_000362 /LENGTH=694 /DNA_ID=CAMNT_0018619403 /DNA_START=66 /DNA_END=2146 /DNA_ORIENTATION=+
MAFSRIVKAAMLATLAPLSGATSTQMEANPIRKVVTMLQAMQSKVTEEGEKAEELFGKFMCYCKNSGGDLSGSIQAAELKIAELGPEIQGAEEKKLKTEEELKSDQDERVAAKTAMAEATALRETEKGVFDKYMAESSTNLAALNKAITAVEKGMSGGFLQTRSASVLKAFLSSSKDVMDTDRQELLAFLSAKEGDEYAPQSGEITGILKTIKDEMFAEEQETEATEAAAVKSYEEVMAAKKKEVAALSKAIEQKLERIGALGVKIAEMKSDLGDSVQSLDEDKKFLAELDSQCVSKSGVHEEEKKMRAQEIVALADTIKILNDDDALDLFKKTLPGASMSFVQVASTFSAQRKEAMSMLAQVRGHVQVSQGRHRIDIVMLALSGKKMGFEKVIQMIDELVVTLKKEQGDDESKKEYCAVQFDQSDDKKKALERSIGDLETLIAETKEGIATATEEIAALLKGISELDKSVAEATEMRQAENAEYKDLMAGNGAAKELILFARNRMNKFYNPKLYKAAPKQELSKEDRIMVNNGGTPPPTEAPGGIAGTGISVSFVQIDSQVAPPPPPATAEAYKAAGEESGGVIAMMDLLVNDITKEMTTAEAEEKAAQGNYEAMMTDSAEKRAMDWKSLTDREGAKADMTAELEGSEGDKASASKELMVLEQYMASLHAECDWLLQYFEVRKQARADEVDSL